MVERVSSFFFELLFFFLFVIRMVKQSLMLHKTKELLS